MPGKLSWLRTQSKRKFSGTGWSHRPLGNRKWLLEIELSRRPPWATTRRPGSNSDSSQLLNSNHTLVCVLLQTHYPLVLYSWHPQGEPRAPGVLWKGGNCLDLNSSVAGASETYRPPGLKYTEFPVFPKCHPLCNKLLAYKWPFSMHQGIIDHAYFSLGSIMEAVFAPAFISQWWFMSPVIEV